MTSQLSFRGRLPSWNRPGLCRRSGTDVRKLAKDQLPSISLPTDGEGKDIINSKELVRINQLEKNVLFLRQQHHETLDQLHKEIERLKNENRELNLKLVMCHCGGGKGRGGVHNHHWLAKETSDVDSGMSNDELRTIFLEEEVRELRNRIAIERNKSNRLMRVIEKKVLERQKSSSYDQSDSETGSSVQQSFRSGGHSTITVTGSRLPDVEECEMLIKQLQTKNSQQAHELLQIKADLRDVLYSHKWTPDAFLMARAYISDESSDPGILPHIEPVTSKQTLERAYQRVKEEVTLPALRPKVPSMVAERHRRAQAVRGRLAKPLF